MSTDAALRLAQLGVPAEFHAEIGARRSPRFHTLTHLTIVLFSIALATAAIATWSRYVDVAGRDEARSANALLYDNDIGAESLGLLFAMLFAGGWLCGSITWRRGSENARNGWAADLIHEPAKNKAVTDWVWRAMINRHTRGAISADGFLDRLGPGIVRDLRFAFFAMLGLTAALGLMFPAHISFATDSAVTDRPILPFSRGLVKLIPNATTVITGCPVLPKEGNTLVYRLRFADGTDANIGGWQPLSGSRIAALAIISARLPAGIARERFSNPIGSEPLATDCIKAYGGDENGIAKLLQLLRPSESEKKALDGRS
ncbi:hypothetical protein [Hyphomicrobium sp. 2TAF46]|uniref:hypothetical protein n=1 Tax=Hyphomicrobium sp. 2TAF46 TaxID=3233019 RepID=UPI003F8FB602